MEHLIIAKINCAGLYGSMCICTLAGLTWASIMYDSETIVHIIHSPAELQNKGTIRSHIDTCKIGVNYIYIALPYMYIVHLPTTYSINIHLDVYVQVHVHLCITTTYMLTMKF